MQKLLLSISIFLLTLIFTSKIYALPQDTISVTPSIIKLDLATDKPQYELTYVNTTKVTVDLALSAKDFSAFDEGWKVNFLDNIDAKNYHYSLSSWISFSTREIILQPGETKQITVYIDSKRITPGTHYASVLTETKETGGKNAISLHGVLSSLLFIRTNTGNEIEDSRILALTPIRSAFEMPQKFTFRFQNQGNVESIPYGLLTITDPFGNFIDKAVVNDGSLITLPESIRRYDELFPKTEKFLLPGIYRSTLSLRYGKQNKKVIYVQTFFTQGSFDLLKIGITIVILLIIAYWKKRAIMQLLSKLHRLKYPRK